jgi:hypothetical protein
MTRKISKTQREAAGILSEQLNRAHESLSTVERNVFPPDAPVLVHGDGSTQYGPQARRAQMSEHSRHSEISQAMHQGKSTASCPVGEQHDCNAIHPRGIIRTKTGWKPVPGSDGPEPTPTREGDH